VPQWLKEQQDLDEMAKRRCLMVLEVLSGEKPVSDVIEENQISRGLYYQLETKAVRGMLAALAPGADPTGQPVGTIERLHLLEAKCAKLEREKRRTDRLLYVTKQVVKPGPIGTLTGRLPRSSTTNGKKSSPGSTAKTPATPTSTSTPTPSGAGARSGGSGN
jgi:hypothetical protein